MDRARSTFLWHADATRLVFFLPGTVPGSAIRGLGVLVDGAGTLRHYAGDRADRAEIGSPSSAERANALLAQAV